MVNYYAKSGGKMVFFSVGIISFEETDEKKI